MRSKISPLQAEGAETVADHRFLPLLGYARYTTDHLDRGGFFMRPGDRVNDIQCANTISNRQRTDTPATGVSIGREGSCVLSVRASVLERALGQLSVKA